MSRMLSDFISRITVITKLSRQEILTKLTDFVEMGPSREAASCAATKNFPAFYGSRRFITVFTRALHWSLSWARWIQSIPLRPNLSFSTNLRLGIPSSLFFWLSHQYPIYIPLFPPSCYIPCPSHPPWLDHCNYIWRRTQPMKLLIMQFSSISRHFISLRSKYIPQHPVPKRPYCMLLP
jgi:hypothetical protein